MLSEPLNLNVVDAASLSDFLYEFFHRDFVANRTYLAERIYVNPRSHRKNNGKEADFWHLTTRTVERFIKSENKTVRVKKREIDPDRGSRIEWVKQIITNHNHTRIKAFYHIESNRKRDLRLYLWAHEDDFIVILQKLGASDTYLVTSFYIDKAYNRRTYEERYQTYVRGDSVDLQGCEWF